MSHLHQAVNHCQINIQGHHTMKHQSLCPQGTSDQVTQNVLLLNVLYVPYFGLVGNYGVFGGGLYRQVLHSNQSQGKYLQEEVTMDYILFLITFF